MSDYGQFSINWDRCVYVDDEISDELVRRLTPQILNLRQAGNAPITVAINSPGGSVSAADAILALITGPDQDGTPCRAVTVVTHQAYSAAAVMLAKGDYAVALPHTNILFHDIRYSGLSDVTPDKARVAAKTLQSRNEEFSLSIADKVFARLMWNFLDLSNYSDQNAQLFPSEAAAFSKVVDSCLTPAPSVRFSLAHFALALFAELSKTNDGLVTRAVQHLGRWAHVMAMSQAAPHYSKDGEVGMLDGALKVYQTVPGADQEPFGHATRAADLNLLMTLAAELCASRPRLASQEYFELAMSEFALMQSINNTSHVAKATDLLVKHRLSFFTAEAAAEIEKGDSEREAVEKDARPTVRMAWLLCVLLCRELFTGDHMLTPRDALILGAVNEVPGFTRVESLRRYVVNHGKKSEEPAPTARIPVRRLKPRKM